MKNHKQEEESRRSFIRRLTQVLAYGGLTHFAFASEVGETRMAAKENKNLGDKCPGGLPSDDVCDPPDDEDKCPGEMPPADECPPTGERDLDKCDSGLKAADICSIAVAKSDQCQNEKPVDDECPVIGPPSDDYCPSGYPQDDVCPPDGGIAGGDECPGGGQEVDNCDASKERSGDECGRGTFGSEDDCKEGHPDECASLSSPLSILDDDSCPNGRNVPYSKEPNGLEDYCPGNFFGSDECWTGTDEDDLCISTENANGAFDVCPDGGKLQARWVTSLKTF